MPVDPAIGAEMPIDWIAGGGIAVRREHFGMAEINELPANPSGSDT